MPPVVVEKLQVARPHIRHSILWDAVGEVLEAGEVIRSQRVLPDGGAHERERVTAVAGQYPDEEPLTPYAGAKAPTSPKREAQRRSSEPLVPIHVASVSPPESGAGPLGPRPTRIPWLNYAKCTIGGPGRVELVVAVRQRGVVGFAARGNAKEEHKIRLTMGTASLAKGHTH